MKRHGVLVVVVGVLIGIFVAMAAVAQDNQAPQLVISDTPIVFSAGGAAVDIAPTGTVSDSDSIDYDGGTMTVTITAGGTADDRLGIRNDGTGPGQIGVGASEVTYSGSVIGTWSGGTDGSTPLVISLNLEASVEAVQALVQALTFWNVGAPDVNQRTGSIVLTEADGTCNTAPTDIFVNEFHYDNVGTDADEFMEIAVGSGYLSGGGTLTGTTLTLYNGNGGASYGTHTLNTFTVGDVVDGYTLYSKAIIGIQNGFPDGFALDLDGTPILDRFQSYEGTFIASNGPWNGWSSVDIGVFEDGATPIGSSLGLSGTGSEYGAFSWTVFNNPFGNYGATVGQANHGQTFRIPNTFTLAPATELTLAVDPVGGGTTVPAAGTYTVGVGVSTLIDAMNEVGYTFSHWSVTAGDATFDDANDATTYVTVNDLAGATVTANFTLNMYALTYLAGANGTIDGMALVTQTVAHGSDATPVTAIPDVGYHFTSWNDGLLTAARQDTAVTGDITVLASFAINQYLVTFQTDGTPGGLVNGTTEVTFTVAHGSDCIPVMAVAPAGMAFAGWSGDHVGMENPLMLRSVGGAMTVTANFAPAVTLTMAVDPPASGNTLPPPGPNTVAQGAPIPIEAMPASGYLFIGWEASANAILGDADAITTTATLSGAATVTANFAEAVRLTVAAASGGSTVPAAGTYTVAEGVAQAIVATPDEGYHFVEWLASINASLGDANAASTTATLAGDAAITPVFEINTYTVVFQTDGTAGALVNGAVAVTYTVAHGSDCTPVTAEPPPGQDFTGWSGDYVGMDNPLTLTHVVGDMTVTASFGKWVAQGLVIELDADDVPGLATPGTFFLRPKFYALYHDPVKDPDQLLNPKKATLKVLTKIVKGIGAPILDCEWTKKIKLYSSKNFKAAQKEGTDAETWLAADGNQTNLALDLHTSTKESDPVDQSVYGSSLAAPEILTVTESVDVEFGTLLTIEGTWFGTKRPKVWREYAYAKTGAIKQQKYKVLKAAEPLMVDSKGKMAYMDYVTGVSKVIVVVPTKTPEGLNGILVLDNGVGMATGVDPTVR